MRERESEAAPYLEEQGAARRDAVPRRVVTASTDGAAWSGAVGEQRSRKVNATGSRSRGEGRRKRVEFAEEDLMAASGGRGGAAAM